MKRLQTIESRLEKYVNKKGDCWLWTQDTYNYGYGKLSIGKGKQVRAHRFMYEKFKGKIPKDMNVLHSCDNTACVNPEHLWLGTQKDNVRDMMNKNRGGYKKFCGETHHQSKLTMENVLKIREMWESGGYLQKELSQLFGVSQQVISKVVNYKAWLYNEAFTIKGK